MFLRLDKQEISEKLNEYLQLAETPIDFTRLKADDLQRLYTMFADGSMTAKLTQLTMKAMKEGVVKDVGKRLSSLIEGEEGTGPLGFGILPGIRDTIRNARPLLRGHAASKKETE